MVRIPSLVVAAWTVAALAAAGCGEGDGGPPTPGDGALLEYSRSGGFAPSIYEVTIDEEGRAVVLAGDVPEQLERDVVRLSDAELDELSELLEENPIDSYPDPESAEICADCFFYSIAYGDDDFEFDSSSETSDGLDAIRMFLSESSLPRDDPEGLS